MPACMEGFTMSMPRLFALLLLLLVGGCATTPGVHYADEYGADGYYYSSHTPAYIAYPAYYDAMWPLYSRWYDPFHAPGFYYGITYFPSYYSHWGWHGWGSRLAWSPWRNAYWDNYHDWHYWARHNPYWHTRQPHLGSAQDRQVTRAALSGEPRRDPRIMPRTRQGLTSGLDGARARSGLASSRYSPQARGVATPARGPATRAPAAGTARQAQPRVRAPAATGMRGGMAPPRAAQPQPRTRAPAAPARGSGAAPARPAASPARQGSRAATTPSRASRAAPPARSSRGR